MIRYLAADDLSTYRTIRSEALTSDPDAFGQTSAALEQMSDGELMQWLSDVIVPKRKAVILEEKDGKPRGVCGIAISDATSQEGFFWGMFVAPAFRRQGIGGNLLREATSWLASRGVKRIRAHVAAPNETAISFYRNCGYTIGEQVDTLRPGSDIPVYEIHRDV